MSRPTNVFISTGLCLGLSFVASSLLAAQPDLPVSINSPLTANGAVAVEGEVIIANQEIQESVQRSLSWDDWGGDDFRNFTLDIPVDKKLVVQTVSFSARVESGQKVHAYVTSQGVGYAKHPVFMTLQGTFNGRDLYVGTMAFTSYAIGNSGVLATIVRDSDVGSGGEVQFSMSGYLVDTM